MAVFTMLFVKLGVACGCGDKNRRLLDHILVDQEAESLGQK